MREFLLSVLACRRTSLGEGEGGVHVGREGHVGVGVEPCGRGGHGCVGVVLRATWAQG